jgi:hypothetical protein
MGSIMAPTTDIFEKTYGDYLAQIDKIDLNSVKEKLGVEIEGHDVKVPLFGKWHRVSSSSITGPSGRKPPLDVCVILSRYLIMCPDGVPAKREWVSFRDFKDSGPLTTYFSNDVERAISSHFKGSVEDLKSASMSLGAYPPDLEVTHDLSLQFDALPRLPVVLLFNDADEEFGAKCSVLFENVAERFLDAECIAMTGRLLFTYLREAGQSR